jgi:hypothetical protein
VRLKFQVTQSKQQQQQYIAERNSLGKLVWYVEMDVPVEHRLHRDHKTQCANVPAGFVPVVPIGPEEGDEKEAEAWATIMLLGFQAANKGRLFRLCLSEEKEMERLGISIYSFVEHGTDPPIEVDLVCRDCGVVVRGIAGQQWKCSKFCAERCLPRPEPPRRKIRQVTSK